MGKCSPILARELMNATTALSLRQRSRRAICAFIGLVLFAAWGARAQDYPNRTVTIVAPSAPGGMYSILARLIGSKLERLYGQSFVIENRPGASSIAGSVFVAHAAPDGYTLLLVSVAYAFIPAIYKLPYDPATAFAPVAILGAGPVVIAVTSKLPVNSVNELIALAKEKPGELNYATAGVGSFQHLASELFKLQAGVDIVHIPFKGGGPAMMDVIAGNTQIAIGSLVQMLPQIKAGKLKALGVGSAKRIAALPDLPTISEAGVPGYEVTNWWGIVVPAGTSQSVIDRLHKELAAVVSSTETKKRFENEGAEPLSMSPEEFGRFIAAETVKWARVVKDAGIRAE